MFSKKTLALFFLAGLMAVNARPNDPPTVPAPTYNPYDAASPAPQYDGKAPANDNKYDAGKAPTPQYDAGKAPENKDQGYYQAPAPAPTYEAGKEPANKDQGYYDSSAPAPTYDAGKQPAGDNYDAGKAPAGDNYDAGKVPNKDAGYGAPAPAPAPTYEGDKKPAGDNYDAGKAPAGDNYDAGKAPSAYPEAPAPTYDQGKAPAGDNYDAGKAPAGDSYDAPAPGYDSGKAPAGDDYDSGKAPAGDNYDAGKELYGDEEEGDEYCEVDDYSDSAPAPKGGSCSVNGQMKCRGQGFDTCDNGRLVYRPCGPGTWCREWNGTLFCDHAANRNAPRCSTEGQLRCNRNGSKFDTCDHGVWVVRDCPTGLTCRNNGGNVRCDH